MKIKVTEEGKESGTGYPYLGFSRTNECLVMFTEKNKGLLISGKYRNGEDVVITSWSECSFYKFKGIIEIS